MRDRQHALLIAIRRNAITLLTCLLKMNRKICENSRFIIHEVAFTHSKLSSNGKLKNIPYLHVIISLYVISCKILVDLHRTSVGIKLSKFLKLQLKTTTCSVGFSTYK